MYRPTIGGKMLIGYDYVKYIICKSEGGSKRSSLVSAIVHAIGAMSIKVTFSYMIDRSESYHLICEKGQLRAR